MLDLKILLKCYLLQIDSPTAYGARGFVTGHMFTRKGEVNCLMLNCFYLFLFLNCYMRFIHFETRVLLQLKGFNIVFCLAVDCVLDARGAIKEWLESRISLKAKAIRFGSVRCGGHAGLHLVL